ncbi:hypothetical protein [Halovivax cerinus]|uniref:Uncharacterized protein n=1 Tax=Halovivax cerinus TaxID=1487865 RepID=A0ABD5NRP9_9EURY|nr:hypothetical protein [Halovivax cerinus]
MGRFIRLLEDGEEVGEINLDTSTGTYSGSNEYIEYLVEKINDGITKREVGEAPEDSPLRSQWTTTRTGDDLKEYVLRKLDGEGVSYDLVEV